MSEPLVTRNPEVQGGQPCLRGTRFPVSSLQSWFDAGGIPYVRRNFSVLEDWSDERLTEAVTYPRLVSSLSIGTMDVSEYSSEYSIDLYTDGSFQINGWFRFEDVPALVIAIQDASRRITDWLDECRVWEEAHP